MEKKQRKEELQSRRQFFKKAAKSALPILGAIILGGTSNTIKASTIHPMGCDDNCWGACQRNCHGGCEGGCKGCGGNCSGECDGTCKGYCDTTCKNCLR
ncbi:MAG: Cys-Xaa-Xaa-Xaa repeat radical SAM target protein [Prevotella sp.]|nr:Cys-Xaa-Xaa-Xaa repeat radical SAM target protein [Prevotella sp.]